LMNEPTKCRDCGRIIRFVRTANNKLMPCEPGTVRVCVTGRKEDRLFLRDEDNSMVRGYLTQWDSPAGEDAHEPHFGRCIGRKEKKSKEEREERRAEAKAMEQDLVQRMIRERYG